MTSKIQSQIAGIIAKRQALATNTLEVAKQITKNRVERRTLSAQVKALRVELRKEHVALRAEKKKEAEAKRNEREKQAAAKKKEKEQAAEKKKKAAAVAKK